jgi:predicted nucleotide-binding protein
VLFEIGLFMGAIERARTLFIIPGDADVKIPTGILGLNPLRFESRTGSLVDNLTPICSDIAALIQSMGPR